MEYSGDLAMGNEKELCGLELSAVFQSVERSGRERELENGLTFSVRWKLERFMRRLLCEK